MKRNAILILLTSVLTFTGCSDPIAEKEYNSSSIDNFEALWKILDERYCYFEYKNIDWDSIYYAYYPKVSNAEHVYELFDRFAEMINELNDGHVNLYSAFDVSSCSTWYSSYPDNYNSSIVYGRRYLGDNYRRAGGMEYNVIGERKNIGYIRYGSFSNAFGVANMKYIDNYFSVCEGIIIDVRNNGGGSLSYSESFAACFFKEETTTGYIQHKTGPGHNDFSEAQPMITNPADAPIDWSDKKVVVLCNRQSYSATNDFVVRMLQAPNVTVIGGITGGGGGMPLSQELPIGWMVRFSAVPMYDSEMNHTEFGVNPDELVNTTTEDEADGYDTIIERAIEIIFQ